MKKIVLPLLLLINTITSAQYVGINTTTPKATLDVQGVPNDTSKLDGIIAPRISGNQLSAKTYTTDQTGAMVYATGAPSIFTGQVINVIGAGYYYFDGNLWQPISKEKQPIEYFIQLSFNPNSTVGLTQVTNWSTPSNFWGNTNSYLTSQKQFTLGTQNYGGLYGGIQFSKVQGIVNVKFQMYRSTSSAPITGNAFISLYQLLTDIGYIPNQTVLLHTENAPTQMFPALLESYSLQIPQTTLNAMSTTYYTYGEVQGFSKWIKPENP